MDNLAGGFRQCIGMYPAISAVFTFGGAQFAGRWKDGMMRSLPLVTAWLCVLSVGITWGTMAPSFLHAVRPVISPIKHRVINCDGVFMFLEECCFMTCELMIFDK